MPLIGGFSRRSPAFPALAFRRCSVFGISLMSHKTFQTRIFFDFLFNECLARCLCSIVQDPRPQRYAQKHQGQWDALIVKGLVTTPIIGLKYRRPRKHYSHDVVLKPPSGSTTPVHVLPSYLRGCRVEDAVRLEEESHVLSLSGTADFAAGKGRAEGFTCGGGLWLCAEAHDRDTDLDLTADEILADGMVFRDKKSPKDQTQLEVAIGDGMEFTIHGESSLPSSTKVAFPLVTVRASKVTSIVSKCIALKLLDKPQVRILHRSLFDENPNGGLMLAEHDAVESPLYTVHVDVGDLKNKLKRNKPMMNNTKMIGNSIQGNHQDNRIEDDFLLKSHADEDALSVIIPIQGNHQDNRIEDDFLLKSHADEDALSVIIPIQGNHQDNRIEDDFLLKSHADEDALSVIIPIQGNHQDNRIEDDFLLKSHADEDALSVIIPIQGNHQDNRIEDDFLLKSHADEDALSVIIPIQGNHQDNRIEDDFLLKSHADEDALSVIIPIQGNHQDNRIEDDFLLKSHADEDALSPSFEPLVSNLLLMVVVWLALTATSHTAVTKTDRSKMKATKGVQKLWTEKRKKTLAKKTSSRKESCRTMPFVGGFSRGYPVSPAPSFQRRSIFTSITLIGSQYHTVKSRPNLFTHSRCEHKFPAPFIARAHVYDRCGGNTRGTSADRRSRRRFTQLASARCKMCSLLSSGSGGVGRCLFLRCGGNTRGTSADRRSRRRLTQLASARCKMCSLLS
ncbi:hypothetical protein PR048_016455 [Dryococelus australis]|uniref:Uncharacterized protein n=1 Tax=Dryococelus australis TaxID=614101 RepID=A0ABQ9HJT9_9NEOP|nr:hypothetical protein PR048_016455 [Dryococelus australis]